MTDERKNEIWAMLDADTQEWIKGEYEEILEDIVEYKEQNSNNDSSIMENRAIGQKQMLIRLFGRHNLTAQAEEKPKEPKFKVGDKVMVEKGMRIVLRTNQVADDYRYFLTETNGISYWYDEDEIKPYPSENGKSETSQKNRLMLQKV